MKALLQLQSRLLLAPADPRLYACVRISFALVALINLVLLWPERDVWLSSTGIIDQDTLAQCYARPYWTVFSLCQDHLSVSVFMILSGVAMVMLLLGVKPRWAAIIVFVWQVSYATRATLALGGWDSILRAISLILVFSPMPAVWSLAGSRGAKEEEVTPNYGLTLLRMQILVIYWQAVLERLESAYWLNGEFMSFYLLSHNARWPGLWVTDLGLLLKLVTWVVLLLEIALPLLLFTKRWYRLGIVLGILLHGGIAIMSINLGMFFLTMLVLFIACLRSEDLEWVSSRRLG